MSAISYSTRKLYGRPALTSREASVPSQLLFREANEQIYLRRSSTAGSDGSVEIICECERRGCVRTLRLSPERYEAVRRFPTRFVMRPGHSTDEDERIVEQHGDFVVVEKTGPSAQIAIRLDPRNRRAGLLDPACADRPTKRAACTDERGVPLRANEARRTPESP
jgi:hypothetical protein